MLTLASHRPIPPLQSNAEVADNVGDDVLRTTFFDLVSSVGDISTARSEQSKASVSSDGKNAFSAKSKPGACSVRSCSHDDINLGAFLGKGGYGTVYTGTWRGECVAVKVLAHENWNAVPLLEKEALLGMLLAHPNIVQHLHTRHVNYTNGKPIMNFGLNNTPASSWSDHNQCLSRTQMRYYSSLVGGRSLLYSRLGSSNSCSAGSTTYATPYRKSSTSSTLLPPSTAGIDGLVGSSASWRVSESCVSPDAEGAHAPLHLPSVSSAVPEYLLWLVEGGQSPPHVSGAIHPLQHATGDAAPRSRLSSGGVVDGGRPRDRPPHRLSFDCGPHASPPSGHESASQSREPSPLGLPSSTGLDASRGLSSKRLKLLDGGSRSQLQQLNAWLDALCSAASPFDTPSWCDSGIDVDLDNHPLDSSSRSHADVYHTCLIECSFGSTDTEDGIVAESVQLVMQHSSSAAVESSVQHFQPDAQSIVAGSAGTRAAESTAQVQPSSTALNGAHGDQQVQQSSKTPPITKHPPMPVDKGPVVTDPGKFFEQVCTRLASAIDIKQVGAGQDSEVINALENKPDLEDNLDTAHPTATARHKAAANQGGREPETSASMLLDTASAQALFGSPYAHVSMHSSQGSGSSEDMSPTAIFFDPPLSVFDRTTPDELSTTYPASVLAHTSANQFAAQASTRGHTSIPPSLLPSTHIHPSWTHPSATWGGLLRHGRSRSSLSSLNHDPSSTNYGYVHHQPRPTALLSDDIEADITVQHYADAASYLSPDEDDEDVITPVSSSSFTNAQSGGNQMMHSAKAKPASFALCRTISAVSLDLSARVHDCLLVSHSTRVSQAGSYYSRVSCSTNPISRTGSTALMHHTSNVSSISRFSTVSIASSSRCSCKRGSCPCDVHMPVLCSVLPFTGSQIILSNPVDGPPAMVRASGIIGNARSSHDGTNLHCPLSRSRRGSSCLPNPGESSGWGSQATSLKDASPRTDTLVHRQTTDKSEDVIMLASMPALYVVQNITPSIPSTNNSLTGRLHRCTKGTGNIDSETSELLQGTDTSSSAENNIQPRNTCLDAANANALSSINRGAATGWKLLIPPCKSSDSGQRTSELVTSNDAGADEDITTIHSPHSPASNMTSVSEFILLKSLPPSPLETFGMHHPTPCSSINTPRPSPTTTTNPLQPLPTATETTPTHNLAAQLLAHDGENSSKTKAASQGRVFRDVLTSTVSSQLHQTGETSHLNTQQLDRTKDNVQWGFMETLPYHVNGSTVRTASLKEDAPPKSTLPSCRTSVADIAALLSESSSDEEEREGTQPEFDNRLHTTMAVLLDEARQTVLETWIVQEFCDQGSLANALSEKRWVKPPGAIPMLDAVLLRLRDIANGMIYLHSLQICHGDLTCNNVLLKASNSDRYGCVAKVSDFGLCHVMRSHPRRSHSCTELQGTVNYLAPELALLGHISPAVDVYAFGIIMWEMLTSGLPAYPGLHPAEIRLQVGKNNLRPMFPSHTPSRYLQLAERCWSGTPGERPLFQQVLTEVQDMLKDSKQLQLAMEDQLRDICSLLSIF